MENHDHRLVQLPAREHVYFVILSLIVFVFLQFFKHLKTSSDRNAAAQVEQVYKTTTTIII